MVTKVDICGTAIDRYNFDEVVDLIVDYALSNGPPQYVVTPNAHHLLMLRKFSHFRQVYREAFLVVPDGVSLLWAAKFLGTPLAGRVNGTDLVEKLCEVAAYKGMRVFFLGGRPGAADQAKVILQKRFPKLVISGTYYPFYGFEDCLEEIENINTLIKSAKPHLLFVGLGAPKQEYWIYNHRDEVKVPMSIGIGISFELIANMVRRAPVFMQEMGIEWLFRFIMEPRRLWKRYLIGNPKFIWLVLRQKFGLLS